MQTESIFYDQDLDFPIGYQALSLPLGIKQKKKEDSSILTTLDKMTVCACFSQNDFRSVAIEDTLSKINSPQKIMAVFSGNANACTGKAAKQAVDTLCESLATLFTCSSKEVILSFTGLVASPFPTQKVLKGLSKLKKKISQNKKTAFFSKGILTTDSKEKKIAYKTTFEGKEVRFAGCVKGAGMIHPNMATMLAFITTDLDISKNDLNEILIASLQDSFNAISVDGQTSTNDSFFLIANGESGACYQKAKHQKKLETIISKMSLYLAKEIVTHAEGASKLIQICVKQALSKNRAIIAAKSIATSLLFKTAIFGMDPNYGRILVALGSCGLDLKIANISILFGPHLLFANNKLAEKNLKKAKQYLQQKEITITIKLSEGKSQTSFYTCDLSYNYIKLNSEYPT